MDDLLQRARAARETAIAPYSHYPVGAAIRTADGTAIEGANIEIVNFSNTLHAEEIALARALMEGYREFETVAIAGPDADGLTPCGRCRQTLSEFCSKDLVVVVDDGKDGVTYRLGDLLPVAMTPGSLVDR